MCKDHRILIADDDRVPRLILRRTLENWGYDVIEVSDGEQAWDIIQQNDPPRIAILDWMMPGIDGVNLCQRLQSTADLPLIYTILLTNKREESDLVYALDNGAHDFQSKPVKQAELRARISVGERLLETHDKLQESLNQMAQLAATDPLTGIANRRSFFTTASKEISRARRYDHHVSVLLIDLDEFKQINDHFGHNVGDAALKHVTEVCSLQLREHDLFGRYGGDEFAVLLIEADDLVATETAERLRRSVLQSPLMVGEQLLALTLSIGVAASTNHLPDIDTLLYRADQALLDAKRKGRNCVEMSRAAI